MHVCTCAMVCVWSENNCVTRGLLFHCYIGSRDQTQVVKLQWQPLYPVSHLICPPCWLMPIFQNTPQVKATVAVGSRGV